MLFWAVHQKFRLERLYDTIFNHRGMMMLISFFSDLYIMH